jgi:hypothetical protein
MDGFDFSKMVIILERIAARIEQGFGLAKTVITFFSICLGAIALRAMLSPNTAFPRVLVTEAVVALVILVSVIFRKPRKPSNPQHPLPSHEPLHLKKRSKSPEGQVPRPFAARKRFQSTHA